MSDEADKQQQIVGGGSDGSVGEQTNNQRKKKGGYGRKAKRVVLSQIRKAKKQLRKTDSSPSITIASSPPGSGIGSCCCLYIKRIPELNLDSSVESPTSDPNSSEFTFDSLRGLIEKSDFLLNECNTHLDVQDFSDNDN